MITVRKLASLPDGTRERKLLRVLESIVRGLPLPGDRYIPDLLRSMQDDAALSRSVRERARHLAQVASASGVEARSHTFQRYLYAILTELESDLGVEPADWDLSLRSEEGGGPGLGGVTIYAEQLRSPFNLGSIARTAIAFGVPALLISPGTRAHQHRRFARSAMGADAALRVEEAPLSELGDSGPIVALETGGTPVSRFAFPESGVLLVGSEELGLSPTALAKSDERVSIPMSGIKASLNVGVAVGIALSWWSAAASSDRPVADST
jgi:TrmH family RNA methyltransferase